MVFELWEDRPPQPAAIPGMVVATSRCFAHRYDSEVAEHFHTMKIGEQRFLTDTTWVIRVK